MFWPYNGTTGLKVTDNLFLRAHSTTSLAAITLPFLHISYRKRRLYFLFEEARFQSQVYFWHIYSPLGSSQVYRQYEY